jgi:N-acetylglucosamine malate deacetylase 1
MRHFLPVSKYSCYRIEERKGMRNDDSKLLVVGAHPDDPDIKAGGIAAKYVQEGHEVRFISVTNGNAGHHEIGGVELARRRRQEAQAAADVIGIEYEVWENHDGELEPTLENRKKMIRLIRNYDPDLILTHRPNDYHPDHRYVSTLVQDSAYMVTVPNLCTDTPALREDPVIGYLSDGFQKPYPFDPDALVAVDDVMDKKIQMLHQHESQMYEWLPYNAGYLEEVPKNNEARLEWLREERLPDLAAVADRFRDELIERYGETQGNDIKYAEAFEGCEYGTPLSKERVIGLFPK